MLKQHTGHRIYSSESKRHVQCRANVLQKQISLIYKETNQSDALKKQIGLLSSESKLLFQFGSNLLLFLGGANVLKKQNWSTL